MKTLIIGASSQISQYLPDSYVRVSSREIPLTIYEEYWEKVYILFAEQRTAYANNKEYKSFFYDTNVSKTIDVIKKIKANRIIFLSTTELWNLCSGPININTDYNFVQNYYTDSKFIITNMLKTIENISICYPFNFNSSFRSEDFLFGKIFKSIKNKQKISVGNLNLDRELLHARYVADKLCNNNGSEIIGAGRLVNVKKFIIDLYKTNNLSYNEYVLDNSSDIINNNRFYYETETDYSYEDLIRDYNNDIQNSIN